MEKSFAGKLFKGIFTVFFTLAIILYSDKMSSAAEEGLFPSAAEEGGSLREYGERLPFPIYKYRNIEEVWPGCRALLPNKNKKGAPTRPKGRMI